MSNQIVLGQAETICGFTFWGVPDASLESILLAVIDTIGMTADGEPDIRDYPNAAGKGGAGVQVYQPLTESWIIGGTWPELNIPRTRVVLSSCKPYDKETVAILLTQLIGPILRQDGMEL